MPARPRNRPAPADGAERPPRPARLPGFFLSGALALACGATEIAPAPDPDRVLRLRVEVLASYPHRRDAFTQGLLVHDGRLYESTGGYGTSSLRRVAIESGAVEMRRDLPPELFGEGLARVGDRLVQLTWREGVALVWDLAGFEPLERWSYRGEGWGLCFDGERLVRSDGTDVLWFHHPVTFAPAGRLPVTRDGRAERWLNELECAEGWIYANLWQRDELVRIDAATGKVMAVIDASPLRPAGGGSPDGVLNGIAHDPADGSFLLTGKNWERVFRVVFAPE